MVPPLYAVMVKKGVQKQKQTNEKEDRRKRGRDLGTETERKNNNGARNGTEILSTKGEIPAAL